MEFRLGTNLIAKETLLALDRNTRSLFTSLQKLSSGKRINSAIDDPAGLVISKQLQTQIASLNQEISNLSANINKYGTASSTVLQLRDQITELRTLVIGAANEAFSSEETQQAYVTAADSLVATYNRTIANAGYNGSNMLDGSEGSLTSIEELADIDLSTPEAAAASLSTIDAAAGELDGALAELGATQRIELESRMASLEVTRQNLQAAESTISDTDYASEITNMIASLIRSRATVALMSHSLLMGRGVVSLFDG